MATFYADAPQLATMSRKRVGWDIDGVLCTQMSGWFSDKMWRIAPRWWSYISHLFAKPSYIISEVKAGHHVITGRPSGEKNLTLHQLYDKWMVSILVPVWMEANKVQPDRERSMEFKVHMIRKLQLNEFHEDDILVIDRLRVEFPNLKVVQHYAEV